jgi:hypothetical protein
VQLRLGAPLAIKPPRLDANGRYSVAQRKRDLREGSKSATYGDDPVRGAGEDRVPRMTQSGGNGDVDVRVCISRVVTWQETDRETTSSAGSARGVLHHTRKPAANEYSVAFGDVAADLEGEIRE